MWRCSGLPNVFRRSASEAILMHSGEPKAHGICAQNHMREGFRHPLVTLDIEDKTQSQGVFLSDFYFLISGDR
jgi:hypothetical protein